MAGARQTFVGATYVDTFPVLAPGGEAKVPGYTAANFSGAAFWNGASIAFTPTIYEVAPTAGQYAMSLPTGFPTAGFYQLQVADPQGGIWESDADVATGSIPALIFSATAAGYPTGSFGFNVSAIPSNPAGAQQSAQLSFTYNSSSQQLFGNCWYEDDGQQGTNVVSATINVYDYNGVLQGTASPPSPDANGVFNFIVADLSFSIAQLLYVQALITLSNGNVVTSIKGIQVL